MIFLIITNQNEIKKNKYTRKKLEGRSSNSGLDRSLDELHELWATSMHEAMIRPISRPVCR